MVLYNHKNKITCFDLPKIGSVSINEVLKHHGFIALKRFSKVIDREKNKKWPILNNEGFNLEDYLRFESIVKKELNRSFIFSIIRNPYERILSSWMFLEPNITFDDFLDKKYYDPKKDNFNITKNKNKKEIYQIYSNNNHEHHNEIWHINHCIMHTAPFIYNLMDSNNRLNLKYIGLLESLRTDLNFILMKNNINNQHIIRNERRSWNRGKSRYLEKKNFKFTDRHIKIIEHYYKYDIKLYNLVKSLNNEERMNYDYNIIFND